MPGNTPRRRAEDATGAINSIVPPAAGLLPRAPPRYSVAQARVTGPSAARFPMRLARVFRLILPPVMAGVLLAGCSGAPHETPSRLTGLPHAALPPMKHFAAVPGERPLRGNADMARDFMELTFRMESGRTVPRFTRYGAPVTIALTGDVPASAPADAERLVARLRSEAGIDIALVPDAAQAGIRVEFVPARRMRQAVPQAACFVVPNVTGWADYLRARRSERVDWTRLESRTRSTVFIPADTSPQEIRDCLHEEVAQALGPLNDLYRLSDSVFNDDNFHTVLTGFDMLMLRASYDPALQNGMTEAEVAARIPAILDRLNPRGRGRPAQDPGPTPPEWVAAIETVIGPGASEGKRAAAARRAVEIARREGWTDARMAFSQFTFARVALPEDVEAGLVALLTARQIYERLPDAGIHAAHVDMQLAAMALAGGEPRQAIRLIDRRIPDAERAENAALLATFLMMKAEALAQTGQTDAALALRLDSLGWARYGFGAEDVVRARAQEIAGLSAEQEGDRG